MCFKQCDDVISHADPIEMKMKVPTKVPIHSSDGYLFRMMRITGAVLISSFEYEHSRLTSS